MLRTLGALIAISAAVAAQAPVPARITQAISDSELVSLPGNTLAFARAANDRGIAPPGLQLNHMLLVLRRSPQQEADLRRQLDRFRENDSPDYHQWLTPQQFGQRFGPAPADLAAVASWLTRSGFTVNHVAAGGGVIEFSGTAATVAAALHTSIHRYQTQGTLHWANAGDPEIPAALAPVVAGVASLDDVRKPAGHIIGRARAPRAAPGAPTPSLTFSNQGVMENVLVPGDLAIIYDFGPLYAQHLDGTGETIAIVARSDVRTDDIVSFRQHFLPSAPANPLATIEVDNDPGVVDGEDTEATLDAEWAGAEAPGAAEDLVVSGGSLTTDGVDLAALYIVDNDLAPVMTTSFGYCEALMGAAETSFYADLWEQAAAEGITALVSAGDSGAAGCDLDTSTTATLGLAVSGLASPPFVTAVGGSEFNDVGGSGYWSTSGISQYPFASALGYIPEVPWNESAATLGGTELWAGSGGTSQLYPKPVWQSAPGVPADGARDLPDLSLTAAGHDGYLICYQESCGSGSGPLQSFAVVGGTSAASPSLAGFFALMDQKAGAPQGLVNPILYRLAGGTGFHDIASGDNRVPCSAGSPNCSSGTLGYSASPGYDLATGLGSIDAAALASQWDSVTFAPSQTTLSLPPPATLGHGQSLPFAVQVTGSGATPSGPVELIAQLASGPRAVQAFTLDASGAVNAATADLPGGTYTLVARYGGDPHFGASVSTPVAVTVAKENSAAQLALYTLDANGNLHPVTDSITYGDIVYAQTTVTAASGHGTPTGTVHLSDEHNGGVGGPGYPYDVPLNSEGVAFQPSKLTYPGGGVDSFSAAYAGDASFNPATSPAIPVTVNDTSTRVSISYAGGNLNIRLIAHTPDGAFPSAGLAVYNGTTLLGHAGGGDVTGDAATGETEIDTPFTLPVLPGASATLSAQYLGEPGYLPSTSAPLTIVTPANLVFTPAALDFGMVAIGAVSAPQMVTLSNSGGSVADIYPASVAAGFSQTNNCGTQLAAGAGCQVTVTFHPLSVNQTSGTLTLGGPWYLNLNGTTAGFSLTAGPASTVSAGQSGTFPIFLYPVGGYNQAVNLSCSNLPPLSACHFANAAPVLNGTTPSQVSLTISTTAPPSSEAERSWLLWLALGGLGLALAFMGTACVPVQRRPWVPASLALVLLACGGGGGGGSPLGGGGGGGGATQLQSVSLLPASLNFSSVLLAQTSPPQTVTLANTGQQAVTISKVSLLPGLGSNQEDFRQSNTCGLVLAVESSCSIAVTFTPTRVGSESAVLAVADSAAGSPQQVALTGTSAVTSTPPGNYAVTVTGTVGPITSSTTVVLIVH